MLCTCISWKFKRVWSTDIGESTLLCPVKYVRDLKFNFNQNIFLGWREFSKISRPSICDLRFEEILNKIKPEKIINERGAIGTTASTSNFTNNGNGDG